MLTINLFVKVALAQHTESTGHLFEVDNAIVVLVEKVKDSAGDQILLQSERS